MTGRKIVVYKLVDDFLHIYNLYISCAIITNYSFIFFFLKTFMKTGPLAPGEFKALMQRNFEVYLTPEETGALMDLFDAGTSFR